MDYIYILLIIVGVLLVASLRIVEQNTVAVVELLGKYTRTLPAGLNILIPLFEQIRERVTLRQQNFAVAGNYPSKDKVIVTVATNLIYSVMQNEGGAAGSADQKINGSTVVAAQESGVKKYVYSLENRAQSITATVENSLRTYIARETHEGILEKKEELAQHISRDLEVQFAEWGMDIKSFQITEVTFPKTISDAMSEVVASAQLRKAAENKGEAAKLLAVKDAEGERERKRLQGEGVALEREAIAHGLKESLTIVKTATGASSTEVMALLTLTQYLDTMKSIGTSDNVKTIFMDSSVGKTKELLSQLMGAMEGK
jgi:regulator of protease activity HflC (stomatin/prohibitin superfamily)